MIYFILVKTHPAISGIISKLQLRFSQNLRGSTWSGYALTGAHISFSFLFSFICLHIIVIQFHYATDDR